MAFYKLAGQMIADIEIPPDFSAPFGFTITFDLSFPVGIILGIALWRHKSWSRTLLLVGVWIGAAMLTLVLLAIPFTGTSYVTLTLGSEAIKNPPVWKVIAFGILIAPLFAFSFAVLYSRKAKEEFAVPNLPV